MEDAGTTEFRVVYDAKLKCDCPMPHEHKVEVVEYGTTTDRAAAEKMRDKAWGADDSYTEVRSVRIEARTITPWVDVTYGC